MTIGSSFDHPAHLGGHAPEPDSWAARYPNPPDLCFDYRRLLEQPGGIGTAADLQRRIAIIGGGIAGLCAARELVRMGFERVTLIEQSTRLGGRHLTLVDKDGGSHSRWGLCVCPSLI
ncbi:FAD-dependent oxidoreductase [Pseudomonas japonica]|uniref:FAD-dependent oxidoreductase n=1 Tax=Pseudomonas japonica TaxID=256466 RepID=UPI00280BD31E|nr:FAD-dependent oxidoreductase [Pseudomonas japonica]